MTAQNIILGITAILTALIAGLLYAYSCSVNIGLSKLPDNQYIAAMQIINREIQNPAFFLSFIGTLIMLPISTFLQYKDGTMNTFWLLLAATVLYFVGAFGITMFGNVPLNEALDKFSLQSATIQEIANARKQFEILWNRFHTIRTIASIMVLLLVIIACISKPAKQII
ncbi:anthrone oxygenase family protein [Flavobacterium cerinum]|uniref:DUF1772 domain-containing protein n=1 Tax=Flavobacterium cerinum TaxID=2502784 RepID=A0A444HB01_9FLAO|nr:anthrone oxygenase family protein [Flavobacterium cerinum]RWX00415.1 DUF1772 domain-containing protein [Flavobacterium cerinum]